jgi:hypothetical protein
MAKHFTTDQAAGFIYRKVMSETDALVGEVHDEGFDVDDTLRSAAHLVSPHDLNAVCFQLSLGYDKFRVTVEKID